MPGDRSDGSCWDFAGGAPRSAGMEDANQPVSSSMASGSTHGAAGPRLSFQSAAVGSAGAAARRRRSLMARPRPSSGIGATAMPVWPAARRARAAWRTGCRPPRRGRPWRSGWTRRPARSARMPATPRRPRAAAASSRSGRRRSVVAGAAGRRPAVPRRRRRAAAPAGPAPPPALPAARPPGRSSTGAAPLQVERWSNSRPTRQGPPSSTIAGRSPELGLRHAPAVVGLTRRSGWPKGAAIGRAAGPQQRLRHGMIRHADAPRVSRPGGHQQGQTGSPARRGSTRVSGPGQKRAASASRRRIDVHQTPGRARHRARGTISGLKRGRPLASKMRGDRAVVGRRRRPGRRPSRWGRRPARRRAAAPRRLGRRCGVGDNAQVAPARRGR